MANNVTDLGKVGMTPAGSWSASSTYERLDVVTYEGSSYVSLVDSNINFNPSTSTGKWQLMAQHGEFTEQQLEDFKAEVVAESKEEMDSYTDEKKSALDTYEDTKETELNTYATGLKNDFDSNANSKTTAFDDNATSKTTAFNTNATNKTTDFNDNATAKTTEFNTNASDKTDDFNDNVTAKTTAFDKHVGEKADEFDEHTAEMQQEIDELSANMPWTETEQATGINITDAAKYSKNKLELFGNTEQASYDGKSLIDYSALNKYNRDLSGAPSVGSPLRYYNNSKALQFNVPVTALREKNIYISFDFPNTNFRRFALDANGNYIESFENGGLIKDNYSYIAVIINSNIDIPISTDIKFMTEQGSTATDYEPYVGSQPAPSPDYPQPIHVVTGNNTIGVQGRNLFDENILKQETNYNTYDSTTQLWTTNNSGSYGRSILYNATGYASRDINKLVPLTSAGTYTLKLYDFINNTSYASALELVLFDNEGSKISQTTQSSNFIKFTIDRPCYMDLCRKNNSGTISFSKVMLVQGDYIEQTLPDYVPYVEPQKYPINLGSMELCKIGDYQDYLYKENGNWYKYGAIKKVTLDGTEDWSYSSANEIFYISSITDYAISNNIPKSNYYTGVSNISSISNLNDNILCFKDSSSPARLYIKNTSITSAEDFKTWLTNHNTDVYYILKVPTSTQITDATLISQLEAIYNHLALVKGTNHITITPSDLAPYVKLSYKKLTLSE